MNMPGKAAWGIVLSTLLATSAPTVLAVDAHHPEQKEQPAAAPADDAVQRMQQNIKKMDGQLEKILQTKDPVERHRLMHEHMQTLLENMKLARGAQGCPMMGGMGMMGGGMMGGMMGGSAAAGDPSDRMQQLEKRLDMMQMMMEQMMRRQKGQQAR